MKEKRGTDDVVVAADMPLCFVVLLDTTYAVMTCRWILHIITVYDGSLQMF